MDKSWAEAEAWQNYLSETIAAGEAAKDAIEKQNLDDLYDANDALYQPCVDCHKEFNPAVQNDE